MVVAATLSTVTGHGTFANGLGDSCDVAIVGGGPAGLAMAIVAAGQGLSVMVLERREYLADKACGEGILPPGVQALRRLGVLDFLDDSRFLPFAGIRFVQEDNSSVDAILPRGGGLGIRRTVLIEALTRRAEQVGAVIRHRSPVLNVKFRPDAAVVRTASGCVSARLLVAADGLHSFLRRATGLHAPTKLPRRFALRQHYRLAPWTNLVEVHVDDKGEAVVTPVSADTLSVNLTWQDGSISRPGMKTLLGRFPLLRSRLGDAAPIATPLGAGPMACAASRRTADRLVLLGDAAGFVDSISGEGLSVAFNSALTLGRHLPEVLSRGASRRSLEGYERAARRLFGGYRAVTNALLWLARHPRSRAAVIHYLGRRRLLVSAVMGAAMSMMMMSD